jgi:hypothetical protein
METRPLPTHSGDTVTAKISDSQPWLPSTCVSVGRMNRELFD